MKCAPLTPVQLTVTFVTMLNNTQKITPKHIIANYKLVERLLVHISHYKTKIFYRLGQFRWNVCLVSVSITYTTVTAHPFECKQKPVQIHLNEATFQFMLVAFFLSFHTTAAHFQSISYVLLICMLQRCGWSRCYVYGECKMATNGCNWLQTNVCFFNLKSLGQNSLGNRNYWFN